jgi:class 3 adenylate cyclase
MRRIGSSPIPANLAGALLVYFFFTYVDPLVGQSGGTRPLVVFVVVTGTLLVTNWYLGRRFLGPLWSWRRALLAGLDASAVPASIRRRAVNAPLASAALSMAAWLLAGLFYFPYLSWIVGTGLEESWRSFAGIVFVGGPLTSALAFLLSELYWRQEIPLFFPDGRIERHGVVRVPIRVRLIGTFLVTSLVPLLLILLADFSIERRFGARLPEAFRPLWLGLLRTQLFIALATGVTSIAMAFLVARFINRPVQALRTAMARVAAGDFEARVPVRSADELGELNEHFNAMVDELRAAERTREMFGRYVSPAVARQALERGIELGGEVLRATAMFVDLRGFTALTQRTSPARVVEILNQYYALVERVCEPHHGVITQFLGDGVVVVFGGPLDPIADHARRAVAAARALQAALAERNAAGARERLEAGIGICTGDMIAGNVGAGGRVTYTIVGDAVNQAARLQVKTRELGAAILVTASTRAALDPRDVAALRACGPVPLKGVSSPVDVFAVSVA